MEINPPQDAWDEFMNVTIKADRILAKFRLENGSLPPLLAESLWEVVNRGLNASSWILTNQDLIKECSCNDKLSITRLNQIKRKVRVSIKKNMKLNAMRAKNPWT